MMRIEYCLKEESKRRKTQFIPETTLKFGELRTDHMFIAQYDGKQWTDAKIVPYGNITLPPGAVALHYGQEIFEGAKAFMHQDGELYTFRLDKNAQRMNKSAEILCMPAFPEDDFVKAIHALIDVDRLWFPKQEGATLYIRPFMFGTQDMLGVKPSKTYTFCVFLSPSGPYYSEGFTKPIKLLISNKFHRAASGGSGNAKAAGNYGASLKAGQVAHECGASQVLFLDATNKYIEEAGSMNHFHVTAEGEIIIPTFTDSILRSITSESVIEMANSIGHKVRQEKIPINDFVTALKNKKIVEAGGFGTAAVVTSVGSYILENNTEITVGDGNIGKITKKIYDTLTGIQTGKILAPKGWIKCVERIKQS